VVNLGLKAVKKKEVASPKSESDSCASVGTTYCR